MTEELEKKLYDEFPKLFKQKDLSMRETCMCWGCSCDDGWYSILYDTCTIINDMISLNIHLYPQVEFGQVKEKFGTLRIYFDQFPLSKEKFLETDEARRSYEYNIPLWVRIFSKIKQSIKENYMYKKYLKNISKHYSFFDDVIDYAEYLSAKTCEVCGNSGVLCGRGGWLKTLCENHMKEEDYQVYKSKRLSDKGI